MPQADDCCSVAPCAATHAAPPLEAAWDTENVRRFEPPPHVTVQLHADQLPTQSTGSVLQVEAPRPQPATPGAFSRNVLQPAGRGQSKSLPSEPRVTYDIQQLSRWNTTLQRLDGTTPVSKLRIR